MQSPSVKFKTEKEKLKEQERIVGPTHLRIEYNSHQGQREMARRRKRLAKQLDKHFGI